MEKHNEKRYSDVFHCNVIVCRYCDVNLTVKTEELKKDAVVMKEEFERVVDRKDAILKSLARDIEEAEEQYPCVYSCN